MYIKIVFHNVKFYITNLIILILIILFSKNFLLYEFFKNQTLRELPKNH